MSMKPGYGGVTRDNIKEVHSILKSLIRIDTQERIDTQQEKMRDFRAEQRRKERNRRLSQAVLRSEASSSASKIPRQRSEPAVVRVEEPEPEPDHDGAQQLHEGSIGSDQGFESGAESTGEEETLPQLDSIREHDDAGSAGDEVCSTGQLELSVPVSVGDDSSPTPFPPDPSPVHSDNDSKAPSVDISLNSLRSPKTTNVCLPESLLQQVMLCVLQCTQVNSSVDVAFRKETEKLAAETSLIDRPATKNKKTKKEIAKMKKEQKKEKKNEEKKKVTPETTAKPADKAKDAKKEQKTKSDKAQEKSQPKLQQPATVEKVPEKPTTVESAKNKDNIKVGKPDKKPPISKQTEKPASSIPKPSGAPAQIKTKGASCLPPSLPPPPEPKQSWLASKLPSPRNFIRCITPVRLLGPKVEHPETVKETAPTFIKRKTPNRELAVPVQQDEEVVALEKIKRTLSPPARPPTTKTVEPSPKINVTLKPVQKASQTFTLPKPPTKKRIRKRFIPRWRRQNSCEEEVEEEVEVEEPPEKFRQEGATMTEAEMAMQAAKKKQEDEAENKLKEYEEQRRAEREVEEEELRQLKEKQERRKQEREEEERLNAERMAAEEERRRAEEAERKAKQEEAKRKKEEEKAKRAQLMAGFGTGTEGKPNFVINKKQDEEGIDDKFGNIVKAKSEMGLTKEQQEEQKHIFLENLLKPLDLGGLDIGALRDQVKELHQRLCKLEAHKYDLEKRHERQTYDLKELNERQRQIARNKALQKGLDPDEAASSRYPAKVSVQSKFDRRTDQRSFRERRSLFQTRGAIPHFPNVPPPEQELEKKIGHPKKVTAEGEEVEEDEDEEEEEYEEEEGEEEEAEE